MEHTAGHDFTYKQYPQRWRMLATIFFANLVLQSIFITFAPIATAASQFYNVDLTAINWLALVWPAMFIPASLVSSWSYHKYGLRVNMLAAGIMMAVGTCLRLLSLAVPIVRADVLSQKDNRGAYTAVLIGTMLVALVQPVVLSSTTLVAASWFSESQRGLANTLMLIGYPVGLAIGAVVPPAMVNHQDGHGIDGVLLLQFGLAAAAAIFCFGLSSAPPSAPSATAPYRRGNDNLGRDLKSLRRNFGFMTLCNIWGLCVGAIQALLTLLQQILHRQGYSPHDAGGISAALILCGIVGAAIAGPVVDATRKYKLILAICISLALPFMVLVAVASQRANRLAVLYACASLLGFLAVPVLPVALDMSAEITYPIPAGLTSTILWFCSQVTALVLVILIDGPLAVDEGEGPDSLQVGTWLLVGCIAAATFLSWLWSGRYVRYEAEGTVERLRQAQRRDLGVPFVATVIDQPGETTPRPSLSGGNATVAAAPIDPVSGLADHGNAAAVAAYVAASQAVADGESPKANVFDPQ
eukprot:jgi/Ulvmu1/9230/UM005_0330.1